MRYLDPGRNGGFAAGVNVALARSARARRRRAAAEPRRRHLSRRHRRAAAGPARPRRPRERRARAGRRGGPAGPGRLVAALPERHLARGARPRPAAPRPDVRDRLGAAAARRGARRRSAGSTSASSSTPRRPTGRTARTGSDGATPPCPRRARCTSARAPAAIRGGARRTSTRRRSGTCASTMARSAGSGRGSGSGSGRRRARILLPGDRGRAARRRAALYRLGPVRIEARFRREDAPA